MFRRLVLDVAAPIPQRLDRAGLTPRAHQGDHSLYEAYKTLLGRHSIIVEGLDLREVPAGTYELLCLPLRLEGSDGAPARVVLRSL